MRTIITIVCLAFWLLACRKDTPTADFRGTYRQAILEDNRLRILVHSDCHITGDYERRGAVFPFAVDLCRDSVLWQRSMYGFGYLQLKDDTLRLGLTSYGVQTQVLTFARL